MYPNDTVFGRSRTLLPSAAAVATILLLALAPALAMGPPVCGDGMRQGGEECDGGDFGGQSCADFGCSGGSLSCTASCTIDSSSCSGCGGGAGTGTLELLFTTRSDDVSETNISLQEQRLLDLIDGESLSISAPSLSPTAPSSRSPSAPTTSRRRRTPKS